MKSSIISRMSRFDVMWRFEVENRHQNMFSLLPINNSLTASTSVSKFVFNFPVKPVNADGSMLSAEFITFRWKKYFE